MTSNGSPNQRDALAAAAIDSVDVHVLERVAQLYDVLDPVPAGLVDRIRFGVTLDALHAEIAQLQRSGELAGVRGGGVSEAQTVTFTSASLTTMITITPIVADRVRIDGWAAPGAGVLVELRQIGGTLRTQADGDGRFVFDDVARGLGQFVLRGDEPSLSPVVTPSIEL